MAESQQYLLGNERFVTVNIDTDKSEIYKINSDGTRTIYADYNNGVITPSSFSSQDFQRNLAQGTYNNTISGSVDNARGLPPTQVTDPNQPGVPGGSTPRNTDSNGSPTAPSGAGTILRYPKNNTGGYDFLKITTYERVGADSILGTNAGFNLQDPDERVRKINDAPVVALPMQPGISDSNSVDWGSDQLNPIQLALGRAAYGAMGPLSELNLQGAGENVLNAIKSAGAQALGDIDETLIKSYFAGQAVGANFLTRATGKVINPNLELLFRGPQLRTFSYNYTFTPRDPDEARDIRSIIRHFKKNMAVQKSSSGLFLETPYVFGLEYIYLNGGQHPFLNKIKKCALTNFNVEYTPDGSYMTYRDGSMTSYSVSMQFSELSPIYNKDYDKSLDDMGY